MIKTLADAVPLIEYIMSSQGKTCEEAIAEAKIPLHLHDQILKYFAPPLEIVNPNILNGKEKTLPKCNPSVDSPQKYFGAYKRFLINTRGWNQSAIETLEATSLKLIKKFPLPNEAKDFQVRGLVVGYIQSGKTANMAALIARAADEGYKLIIVLGGLWKDLRAQTQKRFDQEIVGFSDNSADGPFVVHDSDTEKWVRLTKSGLNGDFKPGSHTELNPKTPKLAVIKKNKKIEDLMNWLGSAQTDLRELPALIIDDEADQGSINTNAGKLDDDGEPIDPSATNGRIRDLLKKLPKSVYIGFTATPFANVLIDEVIEKDLYPRDFIATLPEPPGYFGPKKLFGLGLTSSDLSPDPPEKPTMDLIRIIDTADLENLEEVIISGGDCPDILSEALLSFVLSCCARLHRGQADKHFSMLVHPSQRIDPHRIFAKTIEDELVLIRSAASKPRGYPDLINRAKAMWISDFKRVTTKVLGEKEAPDFDTIWKYAKSLTEDIEVKVLNTKSQDELDYNGYPKRYIVVGGNRLSRGLTLEGLSVSVFTRNANQYDTLLQMGRWFGFRQNYEDLTRIFVGEHLAEKFAELARVEEELRADLAKYASEANPPSPEELKPIIRKHPTMMITSRLKLGAGKPINISYQNTVQQTVSFPVDKKELLIRNLGTGKSFISGLKGRKLTNDEGKMHIWSDVQPSQILDFFLNYEFSSEARQVNRESIVRYITRQNTNGELVTWDVVLPIGNEKLEPFLWNEGVLTKKITRLPMTPSSIKVLSSPSNIRAWKKISGHDNTNPKRGCLMLYLVDKKSDRESDIKFFPEESKAEDILGVVIIFPESKSNETIPYFGQ